MNSRHMPMAFTSEEKGLVKQYLRRFKHSPMCMKMLMCSYYADRYTSGFITPKYYLELSMKINDNDASLIHFWNLNKEYKSAFFGFETKIILNGTVSDVEKMIIEKFEHLINNKEL